MILSEQTIIRQTPPTAMVILKLRMSRTMTPARSTIQLVIPDLTAVHFMEDTTRPGLLSLDHSQCVPLGWVFF
jgi:hypothetical protein